MQMEIHYLSYTEMRNETRDFGVHFSAPEMPGFGPTFFCMQTASFSLQFWRICLAI
jgi:hypothetical protein